LIEVNKSNINGSKASQNYDLCAAFYSVTIFNHHSYLLTYIHYYMLTDMLTPISSQRAG